MTQNILINRQHCIKIIDFGSAARFGALSDKENYLTNGYGTSGYMAPEIVNGFPYHGPEQDMWYVVTYSGLLELFYSGFFPDSFLLKMHKKWPRDAVATGYLAGVQCFLI